MTTSDRSTTPEDLLHAVAVFYLLLTAVLLVVFTLVVTLQSLPRLVARGRDLVRPRRSPVAGAPAATAAADRRLAA